MWLCSQPASGLCCHLLLLFLCCATQFLFTLCFVYCLLLLLLYCCRGVQCHDTLNGAQCDACPIGYEGDGRTCSKHNPCVDGPCPSGEYQKCFVVVCFLCFFLLLTYKYELEKLLLFCFLLLLLFLLLLFFLFLLLYIPSTFLRPSVN